MTIPTSAIGGLAQSSNAFGFDLYRRLRWNPGNLVISPASLATALAMTWGGARGETAAQMSRVLHLEGAAGEVPASSGKLLRSLQDPSRPVICRVANQLFVEKTYELLPAFVEMTREAFGATVEPLDFQNAPEPSRVHINDWVETQTEHRIKDLIPQGSLGTRTRLILANAIYFLGDWAVPFEHEATHPAPFHLTASQRTDVPMMHRTGIFRLAEMDGVAALEIPYKGESLSMLLLIPIEIEGLGAVESALDEKRLDALVGAMRRDEVRLSMPKFELNPGGPLDLKEDLMALGMPLAFDERRADFTGIANPPDAREQLIVDNVFHKGFVRVDEKGTEAAAATAAVMRVRSMPSRLLREIRVDHPFLFLIRDNASGMILFLGRVSDPRGR
jgi:serpin B